MVLDVIVVGAVVDAEIAVAATGKAATSTC